MTRRAACALGGLLGLAGPLAACSAAPPAAEAEPRAAVLARGSQCGRTERTPAARWIEDRAALERARAVMLRTRLGGPEPALPALDFTRERALLVWMGQRSTAGHALELADPKLRSQGGGWTQLRLTWIEPAAGSVTAQVLTSPCLLLSVPRAPTQGIEILDGGGFARLRVPIAD